MDDKFRDFILKIPLFKGVEVLVKKNQEVEQGQIVAKLKRQEQVEVNIAEALKVKPVKVVAFLEVGPGRRVGKGQILAQKKGLLAKKKVVSPVTGKVKSFVRNQGILKIQKGEQVVEIKSPLDAKIINQEKNFLVMQFPALVYPAQQGFGRSGWGNLVDFSSVGIMDLKEVGSKIVLVRKLSLAVLNKLEALGATGAVCLKIAREAEKEVGEIGLLLMREKDFEKIRDNVGKRGKVDVGDKRLIVTK